jgi:predicted nucleotidyltransferase
MSHMMNAALMAELFGGMARYKALRCLYEQPARAFGTRELAALAGIDPSNASRWLRRWTEVGLVQRRLERGSPVFQASGDPWLSPLSALLQQDSRVAQVLRERVASLGDDVHAAAIFGSVVRGEADEKSDIDVLLVTDMPQLKAQALLKAAGRDLGRPVNVLAYTPASWRAALAAGDPLLEDILGHPLVALKGDLHAAAQA